MINIDNKNDFLSLNIRIIWVEFEGKLINFNQEKYLKKMVFNQMC